VIAYRVLLERWRTLGDPTGRFGLSDRQRSVRVSGSSGILKA